MSNKTQPARGMRDFLPPDVRKREFVIGVIKEVYESYGFEPLETPAVENLETLTGKYGEEGSQLMFRILKRGEKLDLAGGEKGLSDLALRYDLTVPLARVVANYKNELPRFFKRYQIQPVWRADRPARGRYREFYQCDVDAIGSSSMLVEAELISAVSEILKRLGFEDFVIRVNHREILTSILEVSGVSIEKYTDALVALDKIDKIGREGVERELQSRGIEGGAGNKILDLFEKGFLFQTNEISNTAQELIEKSNTSFEKEGIGYVANREILKLIEEYIGDHESGKKAIRELKQILQFSDEAISSNSIETDIKIRIDPSLARGLSYYTGAIFEIQVPDLAGSLGGGGRYDGLIGMFGKEQIPACGFSLGLERILVVMDERGMFPPELQQNAADVLVTVWDEQTMDRSLKLAADLRTEGLRVLVYPKNDKLGKQFKYASTLKIPTVAVIGPEESQNNLINIKDLNLGEETVVSPPAKDDYLIAYSGRYNRKQWRDLEREVFIEFVVISGLKANLASIQEEKFPKTDISFLEDGKKHYFEIKIVTTPHNVTNQLKETLSRYFYTPDGLCNLLYCFDSEEVASKNAFYKAEGVVNELVSNIYQWNSIWFYERNSKEVKILHKKN